MQHVALNTPNVHINQDEKTVVGGVVKFTESVKRKFEAGETGALQAAVIQISTQDVAVYAPVKQIDYDIVCCFCGEVAMFSAIVPLPVSRTVPMPSCQKQSRSVDHWCGGEPCKQRFTAVHSATPKVKNSFVRRFYTKTGLAQARKPLNWEYADSE